MLPLSRNASHDNTTQLKPATVDDIQDCIIGAKHGLIPISIPAAVFRPSTLDGAGFVTSNLFNWEWASDNRFVKTGLVLPAGTQIIGIDWHIDKAGHAAAFHCSLRGARLGDTSGTIPEFEDDDVSSGFGFHVHSQTFDITIADGVMYTLSAGYSFGAGSIGATKLEGCVIYVQRP